MIRRVTLRLIPVFLFAIGPLLAAQKIADIRPQGFVTDLAGVISPAVKSRIETLAAEVQQKTGAQMAIVTVNSFEGESREDYAADLYKHLGIGSKKDSNGVLLLIAPKERQYKIEVGYGLEPVINDARAGDVGREMIPALKQNDYSSAALAGATRLAQYIAADKGVQLNGVPAYRPRATSQLPSWAPILIIVVLFVIIGAIARAFRGGGGSRFGGGGGGGGTSSALPWILLGNALGGSGGNWGGGFGGSSGGFSGGGGGFGGFGGFGGGSSGGGGAGGSW
jgi:uncharacterized protein